MGSVRARAWVLVLAMAAGAAGVAACGSKDEAATKGPALDEEDPPGFVPVAAASMLPLPANAGPPQVVRREAGTPPPSDAGSDVGAGSDTGGGDSGSPSDAGGG